VRRGVLGAAESSVAIRIWNGSSCWLSEIFSMAGSSMPSISRASVRITVLDTAGRGVSSPSPQRPTDAAARRQRRLPRRR
jgi:hypothetical protein